jgi:hypothetical protein
METQDALGDYIDTALPNFRQHPDGVLFGDNNRYQQNKLKPTLEETQQLFSNH